MAIFEHMICFISSNHFINLNLNKVHGNQEKGDHAKKIDVERGNF